MNDETRRFAAWLTSKQPAGTETRPEAKPGEPGPADPAAEERRLRLDWTRLNGVGQPAATGRVNQSLVGGREKTVTVEIRRRRPSRRPVAATD